MPNAFIDTNILVHAANETTPKDRKTTISRELLLQPDLHLSVQVLNEFVAVARHPDKLSLTREREKRWLEVFLLRPISALTGETFVKALEIHIRYGISHWDSLIIASAVGSSCEILYSEDLNHGQEYWGVEVRNPFL